VGKPYRKLLTGKDWKRAAMQIPLITFPRDTPMRTLTDKICISDHLEFKNIYSVNNIEGLKTLVKQGIGGAFVMRSLVQSELQEGVLFEEEIPLALPKSGISFVTRIGDNENQNTQLISKLLKAKTGKSSK
jgi:DNA-binding transcriptional LysR family regulator